MTTSMESETVLCGPMRSCKGEICTLSFANPKWPLLKTTSSPCSSESQSTARMPTQNGRRTRPLNSCCLQRLRARFRANRVGVPHPLGHFVLCVTPRKRADTMRVYGGGGPLRVFLSHIHEDAALGAVVKAASFGCIWRGV